MIKINISFIGAGKVGFSLGKYFAIKNHNVVGFYSSSLASSKEAADFIGCSAFNSLEELVSCSDFIFITTNDVNIPSVWNLLKQFNLQEKIICHCSGSISSRIFSQENNSSIYTFSLHPMYAFSNKYESYKNLQNAYFSIEGNNPKLNTVKEFIESLGNKTICIESDHKELYHLCNVIVSNLVLSLIDIGASLLTDCTVPYNDAINALMPLINNNINNIESFSPKYALTGPIERNDLKTIESHLKVIPLEYSSLYKDLSMNLVKLSKEKNASKDYSNISYLLQN